MTELRTGLSYDDVLLVPKRSPVDSRSRIDLSTALAPGLELSLPITSAAMDTVTGAELATAMSEMGGLGVVHRFLPVDDQAAEVRAVAESGEQVAAAVGIDESFHERGGAAVSAGADALVVDVAHGHMERCLDAVAALADAFPDVPLIAGNVATPAGVSDLAEAGADCVKVGVGPGSHCTTREVAGAGVPQFTAVRDCATAAEEAGVTTIADGGIRTAGGIAKALVGGADAVMIGGLLSGTAEAPGELVERNGQQYKVSRGMASEEADVEREDKDELQVVAAEGVAGLTPYRGTVADVLDGLAAGVRSGISYCGAYTLAEARENGEFIRNTEAAKERAGVHGDVEIRSD